MAEFGARLSQQMLPRIVILTGSGVSAESGLLTFRDSGGLWENHDIYEVASPQGWRKDPALVLDFYNKRRAQAALAQPNTGHVAIAEMQQRFGAQLITQNVDDLHERAGSEQVLHLHGELRKVRSTTDPGYISDVGSTAINVGDVCPQGGQLRPHIVWFGESVPLIDVAAQWCREAHILIVAGTSLEVYPAAGLVDMLPEGAVVFVVDPQLPPIHNREVIHIAQKASTGLPEVLKRIVEIYGSTQN